VPKGWHRAGNGEVLPKGWHIDPKTGMPVQGHEGVHPGDPFVNHGRDSAGNRKRDVHEHKDGSVSIGRDGDVTISPEGKNGSFTIAETDPDGTVHTYRVHFDQNGDPVVREVSGDASTSQSGDPFVNHGGTTDAGSGLGSGIDTGSGQVGGSDLGGGATGIGDSGLGGVTGQTGDGGSQLDLGQHGDQHGHHPDHQGGTHTQLQEGAHVGADNAMGSTSGTAGAASPVAGSAAAAGAEGGHGSGFGGFPMGMGRGAGGGGEQEAARRYAQRGDVVGEDDLEEWQRMGPVLGEQ
jgi:hypothetical protein